MYACIALVSMANIAAAAPFHQQKVIEPAEWIAGTWIETSVQYGGEDLFVPPGSGNQMMTFDGKKFREHLKSGKTVAEGEFKLVKGKDGVLQLDLPGKIIVRQPGNPVLSTRVVTHAAIVKFDDKDKMTICYFDPDLVDVGTARPKEFSSTARNGAVLITLKRLP